MRDSLTSLILIKGSHVVINEYDVVINTKKKEPNSSRQCNKQLLAFGVL